LLAHRLSLDVPARANPQPGIAGGAGIAMWPFGADVPMCRCAGMGQLAV